MLVTPTKLRYVCVCVCVPVCVCVCHVTRRRLLIYY